MAEEQKENLTICAIVYPWAQMIENEKYRSQFIEWLEFLEWVEYLRYCDIEKATKTGEITQSNEFRHYRKIREIQKGV
jgi:hypothetical protein